MFSPVRAVLLRPLVNRDENRLIYPAECAWRRRRQLELLGAGIQGLRARVKTLQSFGDFSTVGFTMVGLGEPRSVQAGVVGGSYFQVMGLRPVLSMEQRPVFSSRTVLMTRDSWSGSQKETTCPRRLSERKRT
jgi:putative ABC transport system permease protein